MNPYCAKSRLYLLLAVPGIAMSGALFFAWRESLAYGRFAPTVLITTFIAASGVLVAWLRARELTRTLAKAEHFTLSPDQIPALPDATYTGSGFVWTTRQAEALARLEMDRHEVDPDTAREYGGNWFLHGLGAADEVPLFIPNHLLTQHTLIVGTTGVGKTRLMELLLIQAIRRGDAIVIIDPKGDERLLNRIHEECGRAGRGDDFRLFALPYPYRSVRYNPLSQYVHPHEIADRIAPLLPAGGDSEPFRNYAYDVINTVAGALHGCGEPITIHKLKRFAIDHTWELVRLYVSKRFPVVDKNHGGAEAAEVYEELVRRGEAKLDETLDRVIQLARKDREHFQKMITSLLPILTKLTTDQNRYLLSPEPGDDVVTETAQPKRLTWQAIDRNRLVVCFHLGSMLGYDTANAVAKMALSDFQSYIGGKYAYERAADCGRISVFVDELADVVTPQTINIVNKSRGAEVAVTFAGQAMADLEAALRSQAEAKRVVANMNTLIQFRAQHSQDAELFGDLAGRRKMRFVDESLHYEPAFFSSGKRDVDDFRASFSQSSRWHDEPVVPPSAVLELPKFHYLMRYAGKVFKGRVPLLDPPSTSYVDSIKGSIATGIASSGIATGMASSGIAGTAA